MKIIWSPLSVEKIQEIVNYISEDNKVAAIKWAEELFNKIEKVQSFPQMGRKVPEIRRKDIKEIAYGNYRFIYKISDEAIHILTIRSSKQNLKDSDLEL